MQKLLTLIFLLYPILSQAQHENCLPTYLQCEYLTNPIGLDVPQPRLKWQLSDPRSGAKQQAYQINVDTDSIAVGKGLGSSWRTTKVMSDAMLVTYQGETLQPFTKYYWAVQVWDKEGQPSALSAVASFEMGMMQSSNWQGTWISDSREVDLKPAAYFRKTFSAKRKIKSAKAYVAVGGLYELFINGQRVGDHQLDPGYTRFDRRNLYVAHDVTAMLIEQNAIGVLLGNGWYNHQSTAVWDFHDAPWRARPRFCLDLRITYEDRSVETISTDKSWKTSLSPIVFNSIYTAEHYDARLEQPGWNEANFDDTAWNTPLIATAPSQQIVAQAMHPIRHVEEIGPIGFRKISDQKYLFDLGRNIAGVSRIKVTGQEGTVLRVTHSELLDSLGNIDQSNIDLHYRPTDDSDPFQTDIYTLSGKGLETFSPHFNYKGFQYVEVVSSRPIELNQNSLIGIFMHSDVPPNGSINSSNETLNKLWQATNNSYLSNLFGYPTDCPQREKNGWTGDAHIASETGLYNFDAITIYEKWLADHRDEQQPNGILPSIIPTGGWGYEWGNGPDWTSTIAIIPWNIYLFYGDSRLLEHSYEHIKRYVDHITSISPSGLTDWGLGDWVPVKSVTPKEFTSSIYYFVDATILSKTAKMLGKEADFEKYATLAEKIKAAINAKYFDIKTGIYGSGLQTEQSAALYWNIVPTSSRKLVADNLANRVIADGKHIDVGLLGSKTILNALSENGYADLAYEVAAQETYPSWGWWIANGTTTLLENWNMENNRNDISHNHIMFGEIGAWYFKALGGIHSDPEEPGFKNIILKPNFVKGLDHFEAKHKGPFGEIVSSWKRVNDQIYFQITVPANSTATLLLNTNKVVIKMGKLKETRDDGTYTFDLNAGRYEIEIED